LGFFCAFFGDETPTKKPSCDGFLLFLLAAHPFQTAANLVRTGPAGLVIN